MALSCLAAPAAIATKMSLIKREMLVVAARQGGFAAFDMSDYVIRSAWKVR
jgi:hypothetical protein